MWEINSAFFPENAAETLLLFHSVKLDVSPTGILFPCPLCTLLLNVCVILPKRL